MAKGRNANKPPCLPTATTKFHSLPLTADHISQNHMYAWDPKIFLHEGFPIQPSGLLDISHHSQSFQSPWTPSECLSEPSDTCCLPVWMGGSLLWDHWHSGRPPENSLNQMLGRWAPRPPLRGWLGTVHSKLSSSKKKKKSSLAAPNINSHYYRDRLTSILIWPYSDLFGAHLAPTDNMYIVSPGIAFFKLD